MYIYIYTYAYTIANAAIWLATLTRYLFVNRYRIAASNATRPSFSQKYNAYSSYFEIILNNEYKFVDFY